MRETNCGETRDLRQRRMSRNVGRAQCLDSSPATASAAAGAILFPVGRYQQMPSRAPSALRPTPRLFSIALARPAVKTRSFAIKKINNGD